MERILWRGLVSQGKVPKEHWLLIDALQIVHDWMDKPDDIHSWISGLKYVAERYNLEFKISDYLPPTNTCGEYINVKDETYSGGGSRTYCIW